MKGRGRLVLAFGLTALARTSPAPLSPSSMAILLKSYTMVELNRIRLCGIDCPENGQAFGKRVKNAASAIATKELDLTSRRTTAHFPTRSLTAYPPARSS